jgi:tRNA threonylcarbamoyladenosine biosynthesis protein TsaB
MYLAIDTSGPELSVALGRPGEVIADEGLPAGRQHARALIPMIDRVLHAAGVDLTALEGVLVTDGPGSFTGLRIGAAVAKAMVHRLDISLWTASSLLVQTAGCLPTCEGRVLAVSNALRDEVYAAVYRFPHGRIEVDLHPSVFTPDELMAEIPVPKVLAGRLPPSLLEAFDPWTTRGSVLWVETSAQAATLLHLLAHAGGLTRIEPDDVARWEPAYGRPAEAQARWERSHGVGSDDSTGTR